MNERTSASRSIWPLLVAFGSVVLVGATASMGCGGASQDQPKDPSTEPIATYTTDGFSEAQSTDDSSYLEIAADPPTDVLVDGKPAGRTPIKKLKVTPGSHDVTFDDDVGGPRTMTIKVDPGDYKTVKSDRPISLKSQP